MIYCSRFAYDPTVKVLEDAADAGGAEEFENILVAFIQAEAEDEADLGGVEKKLSKNLKWAAGKNGRTVTSEFVYQPGYKPLPDVA